MRTQTILHNQASMDQLPPKCDKPLIDARTTLRKSWLNLTCVAACPLKYLERKKAVRGRFTSTCPAIMGIVFGMQHQEFSFMIDWVVA